MTIGELPVIFLMCVTIISTNRVSFSWYSVLPNQPVSCCISLLDRTNIQKSARFFGSGTFVKASSVKSSLGSLNLIPKRRRSTILTASSLSMSIPGVSIKVILHRQKKIRKLFDHIHIKIQSNKCRFQRAIIQPNLDLEHILFKEEAEYCNVSLWKA